jgi:hypothetical protein
MCRVLSGIRLVYEEMSHHGACPGWLCSVRRENVEEGMVLSGDLPTSIGGGTRMEAGSAEVCEEAPPPVHPINPVRLPCSLQVLRPQEGASWCSSVLDIR